MKEIRVAIVGVGNCASSLVQGVEFYRDAPADQTIPGPMHPVLGDYHVGDIRFVADLGEHNEEILGDLVGLGSSQIRDLERRGVIGTVPVDADLKRPDLPSLDQLVEHEQLSSYDRDYKRRVG